MTNNSFDKVMADILKGMKVPYDTTSWNRLEKKLKEEEGDDVLFDKVIADKLKAFSVPLSENSFERFEAKFYGKSPSDNNSYGLYKLTGIAAAILLLISGYFYFASYNHKSGISYVTSDSQNKKKESIVFNNNAINTGFKEKINDTQVIHKSIFDRKHVSNISTLPKIKSNSNTSANLKYTGDYIADQIVAGNSVANPYSPNYGLTLSSLNNSIAFPLLNRGIHDFNNFVLTIDIEFNNSNNFGSINPDITQNIIENLISKSRKAKKLKQSDITTNNTKNLADNMTVVKNSALAFNTDTSYESSTPSTNNTAKHNQLLVKASLMPSTNFINTPNDKILKIPGYNQVSTGIGAGLAIAFKKNKHEIESGIDVMDISYSPKRIVLENNKSSFYLDKIEYIKIRIPLVHKYHISENKNWDIYSIVGISANTLFKSKYTFVETSFDGNGNEHILNKLAHELQDNFDFQNTLYSRKDYKKGIKEGAKLSDNLFVSANIGFGIRRKFKKGLSITLEPQYNHVFSDFGPNNDRINSLEFKFGVCKAIDL